MRLASIAFVAGLLLASAASAHGPKIGPNGGAHVEAGAYHVEIVAKGTTLTVYLGDANDKAIASSGHKATAILIVGGKSQRVELTPDGENRLKGQSPVALPKTLKGAVQIMTPAGKTAQGKLE